MSVLKALHPLQMYPQQTLILHAGTAMAIIHQVEDYHWRGGGGARGGVQGRDGI